MRTWNRRQFFETGLVLGAALVEGRGRAAEGAAEGAAVPGAGGAAVPGAADGGAEARHALPGKRPLIRRTYRPPNYETPLAELGGDFTPNDAFFVRYHLPQIPEVAPASFQLRLGGDAAERPLSLSLAELRRDFPQVEVAALCLCAGSRRARFDPRVPGVQWQGGAMGNARWRGVRLRDVLRKLGVQAGAAEVRFAGADAPVLPATPAFVKSLPLDRALAEDTLLAWEMNGAALPRWHGAPLRLVVPGWVATYWMKHVSDIQITKTPEAGFWMKTAYRIPRGRFPVPERFPGQSTADSTPITEMVVNSIFTSHSDGDRVAAGRAVALRGVAWDGGSGIERVEVSTDGGARWTRARLLADHGRFSWRGFAHRFTPAAGTTTVLCRARSRRGEVQPEALRHNPAGYHYNVVQRLTLLVALLLAVILPATGLAQEPVVRMPEGPGRELVMGHCALCHSLDYIPMNSPFLDRKGWEAVVRKMIKIMGAPIADKDAPVIVDYLTRSYGRR